MTDPLPACETRPARHQVPRPLALALSLLCLPWSVNALVLGEADLRSFRGQALEVRIPISVERNEYLSLECFKVRAAQGGNAATLLSPARFRLEEGLDSATLLIRTYDTFTAADVMLDVSARCPGAAGEVSRSYRIPLPPLDPNATSATAAAATTANAEPAMVIIQRPGEAPVVQALGAPSGASDATTGKSRTWRVGKGESLDSIARGIYPKSSRMRNAFIARLRAMNPPGLPGDKELLPEGKLLNWPDLVALANASPKIDLPASAASDLATPPRKAAQKEAGKDSATADKPPKPAKPTKDQPADKTADKAPRTALVTPPAKAPAASTSAPAKDSRPASPASPAQPTKGKAEAGFTLRLSGADLDVSRSKGVSEGTRAALREKQLLLDADDQVAALLSLRNTVKQLESRLNDMQLKLATTPPVAAPAPKPGAASTPPVASNAPAQSVAPITAPAPAAATAPPSPATSASPAAAAPKEVKAESQPAEVSAAKPAEKPAGSAAKTESGKAPANEADAATPWWMSPYLAGGAVLLLALIGLAIWARRKPAEEDESDLVAPRSVLRHSAVPSSQPQQDPDSIADELDEELERKFAESSPHTAQGGHDADVRGPRSSFRPQDTLRIHAPITQETDDEFFAASLELDTRPATAVDFVLGDESGDDKSRRQRYMEERFPELASHSISVDDPDTIIDVARHNYEESQLQRASELLTYAFEERPGQLRFWLALFEIFRLEQRTEDFLELATRFKNVHGGTDAWPKVQHIGRDLDPSQPLYAAALGRLGVPLDSDFDPVSENWLNVPMDFTSDVLMIELRQNLLEEHAVDTDRLDRPLLEQL